MRGTLEERFWAKVSKDGDGGCWLWTGSRRGTGYGYISVGRRKNAPAHRVSYAINVGAIPNGLHIDHLCRVRHCVNPAHLEPVTCKENIIRGHVARGTRNPKVRTGLPQCQQRTHCKHGHPFDPVNTYWYRRSATGYLTRSCRTCRTIQSRDRRAANGSH